MDPFLKVAWPNDVRHSSDITNMMYKGTSHPPWSKLHVSNGVHLWSLRSTASSSMYIWGKKLCLICTSPNFISKQFSVVHVANVVRTAGDTMLTVIWCRSLSGVMIWFPCTLLFVQSFALWASSRCKHDMGTLSWLNAEILERVPTPYFGRLVRCSAHGRSFSR